MAEKPERDERSATDAPERGIEDRLATALLPGFVRRRYAVKFLLTLLVVAVVVASFGVYTYVEVRSVTQADAETTLRSTATIQADNVAEWLSGMRSRTLAAASSDVYADNASRVRSYLRDVGSEPGGDVLAIHYVDGTGRIAVSTARELEGLYPSAVSPGLATPLETVTAGSKTVGVSTAFERRGELRMAFATPVRTGDGVAIVVGNVGEDVEQLHRERSVVRTRILDAAGQDVLDPRTYRVSDLVDTSEFRAARNGSTVLLEDGSNVIALAPIPGTEWVVRTVAPTDALYDASQTVGRNVVVLVAATLAVLVVIGVVLGRQTVLPLVRLRERTEEMANGDLAVDLRSAREDEIGQLYASLSRMRDGLREQIHEVEAAREQLQRQNDRLEAFASTVSHDLRNPLTVAQGNLELLRSDLAADGTTNVDAELSAIDDALDRMGTIIDDVLALARHGEASREIESIDLETIAHQAWASVETDESTLTIDGSRPIEADRDRLQRLLENLFRNAREHAGPDVTVEVGTTEEGFYVADDGPGIAPAELDRVFEYGYTTAAAGTGLGLSIVETIAEAHDWTIHVENDDGARFVFGLDSDTATR